MSRFFVCPSEPDPVVLANLDGTFSVTCSEVFYSIEGGDAITDLSQLLGSIAEFDVVQISMYVTAYLVFFITGVTTGIVMRNMRRA